MMVDIILATCNGGRYLHHQISSIINQGYANWSLLIHDDGSVDETLSVIRQNSGKCASQIVFVDDGVLFGDAKANFSHLLILSDSEYVMFCDQDDVWDPDKLKVEIEEMKHLEVLHPGKPILVHSDLEIVDSNLNTLEKSFFDSQRLPRHHESALDQLILNNVTGCTMLINRAARDLVLPIPDKAIMHDWWIASKVRYHGGIIGFIDQPLVKYRQHECNVVGAQHIGLRYFCSYFMSPLRVLKGWWSIYRQAKAIDPNISAWAVLSRKVVLTYRRLKPHKGKEVA